MDTSSSTLGSDQSAAGSRPEPVAMLLRLVRAFYGVYHHLSTPWRMSVGERMLGELSKCSSLILGLCRGKAWPDFDGGQHRETLRELHQVILLFDRLCQVLPDIEHLPASRLDELAQSLAALEQLVRSLMPPDSSAAKLPRQEDEVPASQMASL